MAEGPWPSCAAGTGVTRVWDLGVRVFQWLMVVTIAIALVTGLSGPPNLLNVHIAAGAAIGGLVAFRMPWGLMGSTYAGDFPAFPSTSPRSMPTLPGWSPVGDRDPGYISTWQPDGAYPPRDYLSFRDDRGHHPGWRRQAGPLGFCGALRCRQGGAKSPFWLSLMTPLPLIARSSPGRCLRVYPSPH